MKMSAFRLTAAVAVSAAVLALAACGGSGAEPPSDQTGSDAAPTEGGDLTILTAQAVTTWDPGASTGSFPGVVYDRLYAIYGALITVNTSGEIEPGIAESLTTDDEGATWTLKLRDGVTFTDGTPFDAEAVKTNWDRFASDDYTLGAHRVASTFTSEVTDDLTLTLTSDDANPVLDREIADAITFIAAPSSLPDEGTSITEPVGAGPFVLDEWDQSVGDTLVKNDDYYVDGQPYLDSLTFTIVADPAQRVSTVVQGGAQIMNGYPFQWVSDADNPAVGTYAVESGGIRHFAFNTTSGVFQDQRAREAVERAIDPDELVQTLTQDPSAKGSTGLFPDSSPYYDASLALPGQDLDEAQSLVDDVTGDGEDFTVNILIAAVPELVRAGELLQLSLQELDGVDVEITQIPITDWGTEALDKDNFDITFYPGVFDLNSPEVGFANLFLDGGLDHFSNFDSPDMQEAIEAAQSATSDDERIAALKTVQEIYVDEMPIVVFGIDYRSFLHTADATGFETMGRGALYTDRLGYAAD